jgi:surface protein
MIFLKFNKKYRILFVLLAFLGTLGTKLYGQDFITKWAFPIAASEIYFNTHTAGTVNYTWTASPSGNSGSGNFIMPSVGTVTLDGLNIAAGDVLILSISPTNLRRFYMGTNVYLDALKLIDVMQWGSVPWLSMDYFFKDCTNLNISANDSPNLTGVYSMSQMFYNATSFNSNIGNWNTSNISVMSYLFVNATSFNQPIGSWNTSNVINMELIFGNASSFNQPIGNWITNNVNKMSSMFYGASSFNQPIGNWNVGSVFEMDQMFDGASSFNQPIGDWNTVNVENMSNIFSGASSFNQNINNWNLSNALYLSGMFYEATAFNQPIGSWNTFNVEYMAGMFSRASSFNQPIGNWNTSNVINTELMFYEAISFNQPIANWNTTNFKYTSFMFYGATVFNQPIGNWNTSNVISTAYMFQKANSFNQPIDNWNTTNVRTMFFMFSEASSFNQPLGSWNTANVENMREMFKSATSFNQNIGNWVLKQGSNMLNMLDLSGMSCNNYSSTLVGWQINNPTILNQSLGAVSQKYGTNAITARNLLINTQGWTIAGDIPSGLDCSISFLPIELMFFTAQPNGKQVQLNWSTALELNNNKFIIEHSIDGLDFSTLSEMKSKGNLNSITNYEYSHTNIESGLHYYRLKQVDLDGQYAYTDIREVKIIGNLNDIQIYPNPSSDIVNVTNCEGNFYLISDVNGKIVKEGNINLGNISIYSLPPGYYYLTIVNGREVTKKKLYRE